MIKVTRVTQKSEIETIAKMAQIVFHEVYDPYTPVEFVNQFIETYQSVTAIQRQIDEENFHYFILIENKTSTGYLGIQIKEHKLILSKIYILKEYRGRKIGKQALAFVNEMARGLGINQLELSVSDQNTSTIKMYERDGYKIVDTEVSFSEDGSEVKDYLMVKRV